jgi:hypothetical protein
MEPGGFRIAFRFLGTPLAVLRRRGQCGQHGSGERSAASGVRVIALEAMTRPRKRNGPRGARFDDLLCDSQAAWTFSA